MVAKATRTEKSNRARAFSRKNKDVKNGAFVMDGNYTFTGRKNRFQLYNHTLPTDELDQDMHVHLSVRRKDLDKAWKIVAGHMIDHNLGAASVLRAQNDTKKKWSELDKLHYALQDRKSITLFNNGQDAALWQEMLRKIEDDFVKHGVRPGRQVGNENDAPRIEGSQYAYIQTDVHNFYDGIDINPVYDDHGLPRYDIPEENITAEMIENAFAENAEEFDPMDPEHYFAEMDGDFDYQDAMALLENEIGDIIDDENVTEILSLPMNYEVDEETGEAYLVLDASNTDLFPQHETDRIRALMAGLGISSSMQENGVGGAGGILRLTPANTALFETLQMQYLQKMFNDDVIKLGGNSKADYLTAPDGTPYPNTAHIDFESLIPKETIPVAQQEKNLWNSPDYDVAGHIKRSWAMSQSLIRVGMLTEAHQGNALHGRQFEDVGNRCEKLGGFGFTNPGPHEATGYRPWDSWTNQSAAHPESNNVVVVNDPVFVFNLMHILKGKAHFPRLTNQTEQQPPAMHQQAPQTETRIVKMPQPKPQAA